MAVSIGEQLTAVAAADQVCYKVQTTLTLSHRQGLVQARRQPRQLDNRTVSQITRGRRGALCNRNGVCRRQRKLQKSPLLLLSAAQARKRNPDRRVAQGTVRGADSCGLRRRRRPGHRRSRKLIFQVRLHASVLQEECDYDSTSTLRLHDADAGTGRCTNYSLHASVIRKWLQYQCNRDNQEVKAGRLRTSSLENSRKWLGRCDSEKNSLGLANFRP